MTDAARIPATIITGFLGAGKTTLVRHLLETARGKRKIGGAGARRVENAQVGGCRRRVYCCAPVTTTLRSCTVVAAPSVARARRTYSPGFEKVAVTAALPESAAAAGGLNMTLAGPRQTNHET